MIERTNVRVLHLGDMEKAILTDRRSAKLSKRGEDYREVTYWFRESFKPHAKRHNRNNRRKAREILNKTV